MMKEEGEKDRGEEDENEEQEEDGGWVSEDDNVDVQWARIGSKCAKTNNSKIMNSICPGPLCDGDDNYNDDSDDDIDDDDDGGDDNLIILTM